MKKIVLVAMAVILLSAPKANAIVYPGLAGNYTLTAGAPIGIMGVVTTLLPTALFATIALGTPFPLCGEFKCYGEYPHTPIYYNSSNLNRTSSSLGFGKSYYVMVDGVKTIRSDGF